MYLSSKKQFASFLFILLLGSSILSGCGTETENTPQPVYKPKVKTSLIQSGLSRTFEITGEVEAVQSSELTAQYRSKVVDIYVKTGDIVSAGQKIMSLSSEELESRLRTASDAINSARQTIEQTKITAQKNIDSAQVAYDTALISLENVKAQNVKLKLQAEQALQSAKINVDLSVDSARTAVDSAEKALQKTKEMNQQAENTARTAIDNTVRNVYPTLESTLRLIDGILSITGKYDHIFNIRETDLGTLNFASRLQAEMSGKAAVAAFENYKESYNEAQKILPLIQQATEDMVILLSNTVAGERYPQIKLQTDIDTLSRDVSAIRGLYSSLSTAQQGLDQTLAANATALNAAQQGVESAKKALALTEQKSTNGQSQAVINAQSQYETTLVQLKNSEEGSVRALASARASLESVKKSSQLSIVGAESQLTGLMGNLEQATIAIDDLAVKASFSGTVTALPISKGQEVTPNTTLVNIENTNGKKVVAYVSPDEAKLLKINDEALVNGNIKTRIFAISATADTATKKQRIELLVENDAIGIGEFVNVRFSVESPSTSTNIFLPVSSIFVMESENYVWKIENGKTKKTKVILGELSGKFIEIKEGVKQGDEIITEGGRIIEEEGVEVEIQNEV